MSATALVRRPPAQAGDCGSSACRLARAKARAGGDAPLPHMPYGIANALFSHCLLVGLPIALIAARHADARAWAGARLSAP